MSKRKYRELGEITKKSSLHKLEGRIFEKRNGGDLCLFAQVLPGQWTMIFPTGNRCHEPLPIKEMVEKLKEYKLTMLKTMKFYAFGSLWLGETKESNFPQSLGSRSNSKSF